MNLGGRPRKEIDFTTIKKLCELFCTLSEIAGFFEVSEDTIERWCEREHQIGFAEFFKRYKSGGCVSIRRMQMERAMKGSDTMLIWLGKQHCGQSDKIDQTTEVLGMISTSQVSKDELYDLIQKAALAKENANK